MDVTTQVEERPLEADAEKPPEVRSGDPVPLPEPSRAAPDLSRTQLGYLRSVLWLPSD